MSAQLLDGKVLAKKIKNQLREEIIRLKQKTKSVPCIKNIMVGDEPAAISYANSQKEIADDVGLQCSLVNLPSKFSQKDLLKQIEQLNRDQGVHGVMIYKPLPSQLDYTLTVNHIDSIKDLEGMNIANLGKMVLGETSIIPCTPASVMEHIKSTGMSLRGKEAVIVGRSEIVGKPLMLLLLQQSATVTVCHTGTKDAGTLAEHIGRADILITAIGKPGFIKGDWVKAGSIVIDVGINKIGEKIIGDVEFDSVVQKASFVTPVPGGVGPVTVVLLMKNAIEAFKLQMKVS